MKSLFLYASLSILPTIYAMFNDVSAAANDPSLPNKLEARGGENGRQCDFSDGYYVPWSQCSDAINAWCTKHDGKSVSNGQSIEDVVVNGYKSGKWDVKFYAKYSNNHLPSWNIDVDACTWYLSYIAQGCTKGGNLPSTVSNQVSDGGTFYEPMMGSVDFKWTWIFNPI